MADVVFITPNFPGFVREEPIGTLLLATILKKAGIDVNILQFRHFGDVNHFETFVQTAVRTVADKKPRVVSFYTRCDSYHISLRIAEQIKAHYPEIYIVFAGPQADLVADITVREMPFIDFVCCGEGETTVVPFFSSLICGKPDLTVAGLVYVRDGQVSKNPRPELIENLDLLPTIDYSLLDYIEEGLSVVSQKLFPIDVGRGCPFACTYCSTKNFWGRKYRLKSADRIIEEIKYAHEKFGVNDFNFEHDMFTMNREKVIHICKKLKNIGFPILWRCSARIDCLDEELVDIMVDAGMRILFVGIETGSPRMQKLIHKNLKLDNVPEKLAYIANKGVEITASFIYGFPEETEEDFAQTIHLMTRLSVLPKISVFPNLCAFFAGTELTNQYIDQLAPSSVYSNATKEVGVEECKDLINAHPVLFPQFCEYKTELREKAKYYPTFFNYWKAMRPIFEYLYSKHYPGRILDLLYEFTDRNRTALENKENLHTIMEQDQLLEQYKDDENYPILAEVHRFLIWKNKAKPGTAQAFGFNVKELLNGAPVDCLKKEISVVTVFSGEDNSTQLRIMTKNSQPPQSR